MDINPILSRPVKRPHFVVPSTCVDVVHGTFEQLTSVAIQLVHGANYNDPAQFESLPYQLVMNSAFTPWSF
jgi:cyanobactin biosynthesis protein (PatB/AcyB/McaB family)